MPGALDRKFSEGPGKRKGRIADDVARSEIVRVEPIADHGARESAIGDIPALGRQVTSPRGFHDVAAAAARIDHLADEESRPRTAARKPRAAPHKNRRDGDPRYRTAAP